MSRPKILTLIRNLGMAYYLDYARFLFFKFKNRKANAAFKQAHPNVALPPNYLMYESFQLDYHKYYFGGKEVAEWLKQHFERHKKLEQLNILDWGCGPGRVIRHLPEVINNNCSFYATDYNKASIAWCKANIQDVSFHTNEVVPPLDFETDFFDVIYGISILTHLSEENHYRWLEELVRVSQPGGVLFLTTHGDVFTDRLSIEEQQQYEAGKLTIRSKVKEGHRVFGAFHPPSYMKNFFSQFGEILEYIPGKAVPDKYPEQDIWIIRV